jgi:hypothetical protein
MKVYKDEVLSEKVINDKGPYIVIEKIEKTYKYKYNKDYGDDKECECGHSYYRHFDSWEDMFPCGCKYCGCREFKEKKEQ